MPQGQDYYKLFQKDENGSAGMTWQFARLQFYRKSVVHRKKSLAETELHYKTEGNLVVIHIWFHNDKLKNICKKLVLLMKKRVDFVLQAKSGHINY